MEFKINRETFLDGIQKTLGIVEKKTTIPILNNILLKAETGKLKIIATDREISLISDYDVDVVEKGEIVKVLRHGKAVAEVIPAQSEERMVSWKQPGLKMSIKGASLSREILRERKQAKR